MRDEELQIPHRFSFANSIVNRSAIGSVYLAVLLMFFGIQFFFTSFVPKPPLAVFLLVALGVALRIIEILAARRTPIQDDLTNRLLAVSSITWTLIFALLLALLTRQPDTNYFGMLILPILESAIYFSLATTMAVAALATCISIFWVIYVAGFHPPYAFGEIIEASTLVLVYFIVGCLVWLLVNLLRDREERLQRQLNDLNTARGELFEKEKLAAVGRLASAVAHEIRNPVAIISSALETSASVAIAPHEREEMARIAMLEAKRLERLTTDFLTYARPARVSFKQIEASTLIGYIVAVVQPHVLEKNLQVKAVDCPDLQFCGDVGQLQQALLNLVRNAIEASPQNANISIAAASPSKDFLQIRIENAGEAIPSHAVQHIFEPFFTTKQGGTGLGLAIVRSIVSRHHGELRLERNEPDHIVFTLTLPILEQKGRSWADQGIEF